MPSSTLTDGLDFHRQILANLPRVGEVALEQARDDGEVFVYYAEDLAGSAAVRALSEVLAKAADVLESIEAAAV